MKRTGIIARLLTEKASKRPVFFVLNKMDRLTLDRAQDRIEAYWALLPRLQRLDPDQRA